MEKGLDPIMGIDILSINYKKEFFSILILESLGLGDDNVL